MNDYYGSSKCEGTAARLHERLLVRALLRYVKVYVYVYVCTRRGGGYKDNQYKYKTER